MNKQIVRSLLSAALVLTSITFPAQQAAAQEQTPPAIAPHAPSTENAPAQPEAVLAEGSIAYVYKTDLATANDYASFLVTNGYSVTLVPVTNTLSTNFQPFDMTLIGADTGALSDWGTAAGQADIHRQKFAGDGHGRGRLCLLWQVGHEDWATPTARMAITGR